MADQNPREQAAAPPPGGRQPDLAEVTGYLAGRTARGLTRLALRSRTLRQTLRNARDAKRGDD